MKKSLLAIAFAMVAMVSSAQIYVGGSLKLDASSNSFNFGLHPEVGYVINENLSAGASLGFSAGNTNVAGYKSSSFSWIFRPYARYTFFESGIFSCFVDGVISLAGSKGSGVAFGIYAQPGVAFNITENLSLVSHIGCIVGWKNNSFTLGGDTNMGSVGVYYTF